MKNTMADVRNHLVAMMETLNEDECNEAVIEKAKALTGLAKSYIGSVKVEIDALRVASETGLVSRAVGLPQQINRQLSMED